MLYLSGPNVQRLMRRHHVTMRALAARMDLPLTRIRVRRQHGIADPQVARDWLEAITGTDPGPLQGPYALQPTTPGTTAAPLGDPPMALITGTLIWDSSLPDDAGWLLFSEQLHAEGPTLPHPDYEDTPQDADASALQALIEATIFWQHHTRPSMCVLTRQGETWYFTANMADH
jgi:hypothetical protein